MLLIEIDFNSEEAIYMQLRNQIIMGIATSQIRQGENLPSVRELADHIGINMHTVNKAYTLLKQEGYLKLDRRKGAVIYVSEDKKRALAEMAEELRVVMAKAVCRNISREEIHEAVDQLYDIYSGSESSL